MCPSRVPVTVFAALIALLSNAQVTYDDVAVIVNVNDPVSVNIGNYFRSARSIPQVNMIQIDAPVSEVVDSAQFVALRQQIESYLIANQLVDSINYIVCTKGVPHRLAVGDCLGSMNNGCSSFDSKLALLLGPYASAGVHPAYVQNPFWGSVEHQQRAETGIYLVTRLDGFTEQDVLDLIDRSGPGQPITMTTSTILVDVSHAPWYVNDLGAALAGQMDPLVDDGWMVALDTLQSAAPAINGLAGFASIELSPDPGALQHTWSPGALASEMNSFGTYTFDASDPDPLHTRAAHLIAHGASGVRGVVTYAYASIGMEVGKTYNRYLGATAFDLAESYWAGMSVMSYTDLVIGDPKTSVLVDPTSGMGEGDNGAASIQYDATNNTLTFTAAPGSDGPFLLQVLDPLGREVMVQRASAAEPVSIGDIACGTYLVRISANDRLIAVRKFASVR